MQSQDGRSRDAQRDTDTGSDLRSEIRGSSGTDGGKQGKVGKGTVAFDNMTSSAAQVHPYLRCQYHERAVAGEEAITMHTNENPTTDCISTPTQPR